MKIVRLRPRLGILFVLAVGIPSVALVVIAVRSIGNEEALIRRRLERTLGVELDHVVAAVASEMREIQEELGRGAPSKQGSSPALALKAWKESTDLVRLPFMLSPDDRLVEPGRDQTPTADALSFLRWNEEFLAGSVGTPVLFNVTNLYWQEILGGEAAKPEAVASAGQSATPDQRAAAAEAEAGAGNGTSQLASDAVGARSVGDQAASARSPASAPVAAAPEGGSTSVGRTGARSEASTDASAAGSTQVPVDLQAPQPTQATAASQAAGSAPAAQAPASTAAAAPPVPAKREATPQSPPASPAQIESQAEAQGSTLTQADALLSDKSSASEPTLQEAMAKYKEDEGVRRRVLEKAKSEGATPVERLVQPQANAAATEGTPAETKVSKEAPAEQTSIYVSRQRTFREIRANASSGIVPRFVNDGLELLYWRRMSDGGTVGCLMDRTRLEQRLTSLLPDPFVGERILEILDEHAQPLAVPPAGVQPDWHRPFLASELHETLPQWEVASYLADPALFVSQVRMRVSLLWLLVAILFASIAGGGAFVLIGLGAELHMAQQRTTFVANVSHELKTPLTSIRMFAEMLREGRQPDPERRQRYLDLMVAESERLGRLVNNVLDFSQLEQGRKSYHRRKVDLAALCQGVVETERPRLETAGFTVAFRTNLERTAILADEDALRQVLANLLSNAEKYSGDTRSVEVEVGLVRGMVFVRVLDRGIGIAPEHAGKIFKEFYRVDDSVTASVKGTGLGLSIARRIARDHGGEVSYRPRDGGGSVFEARFPRSVEPEVDPSPAGDAGQSADDDPKERQA